mmetsp:Transcript_16196/g.61734  ORF Transcript_16196/g.61734 Transcript_16196/m.61734 type:complete len:227 (+) Transcript_16196:884-1564(+)
MIREAAAFRDLELAASVRESQRPRTVASRTLATLFTRCSIFRSSCSFNKTGRRGLVSRRTGRLTKSKRGRCTFFVLTVFRTSGLLVIALMATSPFRMIFGELCAEVPFAVPLLLPLEEDRLGDLLALAIGGSSPKAFVIFCRSCSKSTCSSLMVSSTSFSTAIDDAPTEVIALYTSSWMPSTPVASSLRRRRRLKLPSSVDSSRARFRSPFARAFHSASLFIPTDS